MNKLPILLLLIGVLLGRPPAQGQNFSARKLAIAAEQTNGQAPFQLDLPGLYQYLQKRQDQGTIPLQLTIHNRQWDLELWPSELLHPGYELILAAKTQTAAPSPALFLTGRIAGRPETNVALTVSEKMLLGQIGDLFIEPAAPFFSWPLPAGALISYTAAEAAPASPLFCGLPDAAKDQADQLLEPLSKDQRAGECRTVELAIATDYLALQQFGDPYAMANYYLGILNMVRLLYDDEFADAIRFAVRGFYLSACPDCDPWTAGTDANDLLASFRDWGNAGGFGFSYDLATMWTGRVLDDKLGGLGSLTSVCEVRRYHVLRNYTKKAGLLRTLQAHEIGHNFSARHDQDTVYVMSPVIADNIVWSEESRGQIDRYVAQIVAQKPWCLGGCAPPVANFDAPPITGCAPLLVQFADGSTGEVTAWQWTFEGGFTLEDTLPYPLVLYDRPGVFGVRLRVGNASGESEHVEDSLVVIQASPTSNFTANVNASQNSVQFQFTGEGADRYFWSFGDGATSQAPNPSHTYESGEFEVELIVENGCGADTSRQTISFLAPPKAAFEPAQTVGCAPLAVQFTDLSTGEITERQWFFENGSPAESTALNPPVLFEQPGAHRVRLIVRNAAGESEVVREEAVVVQGPPQAEFTASADQMERRVQFQFTGADAQTYEWRFGDGATSREANPSHTYASSGTFDVALITRNDCGADTSRQTISFVAPPATAFAADAVEACAPATIRFTDRSEGVVQSRRWSFPGGDPATSSTLAPTVRYAAPGVYNVRLETGNAAGSDTLLREAYIRILPGPAAQFQIDGELGDTVFTFVNKSQNAQRYTWLFGDGDQSKKANPMHYYERDGEFLVRLIAESDCGRDTAEQRMAILRAPAPAFAILSETGCSPKVVRFEDRSTGSVAERQWTFPGGEPASSTLRNPVVSYANPGTYDVLLSVRNAAGERTIARTGLIKVALAPVARFTYDYTLGDSIVRFANQSERATAYLWDFGDGRQSTLANPTHEYQRDGDYTVRLEARNECRNNLLFAQITVATLPHVGFRGAPLAGCAPLQVRFESAISENAQSFSWQFPGGKPAFSSEKNPTVTYARAGRYDVRLKASNAAGETVAEKREWIEVNGEPATAFRFEQDGPAVQFFNQSARADTYRWDFGDGQTSEEKDPAHHYQQQGSYAVQLIGQNGCGADTTTQTLTVIINGTDEPAWKTAIKLFPNPNSGRFAVELRSLPEPRAILRLWNSLGQLVHRLSWNDQLSPLLWIHIPAARPGLYLLEVESAGQRGYFRIVVAH